MKEKWRESFVNIKKEQREHEKDMAQLAIEKVYAGFVRERMKNHCQAVMSISRHNTNAANNVTNKTTAALENVTNKTTAALLNGNLLCSPVPTTKKQALPSSDSPTESIEPKKSG